MRIVVAAICRNEELYMQRFLDHVKEADAICLVDTGSTDRTTEIIQAFQHKELHYFLDEGTRNLGRSRRLAASPFTKDDLVVWLDIDEYFSDENWVVKLRDLAPQGPTYIMMHNGDSKYYQLKAYHTDQHEWKYHAHEVLTELPRAPGTVLPTTHIDVFNTVHTPDHNKVRNYLPELAADSAQYPFDERAAFYYCRELCYDVIYGTGSIEEAAAEYRRLMALNPWSDYRCLASIEMMSANYCAKVVDVSVIYSALVARPDRCESYCTAADIYFRYGDNVTALSLAIQGISAATSGQAKPLLFDTEASNLDLCYELAFKACQNLGLQDQAMFYCATLANLRGKDVNEELARHWGPLAKVQENGESKTTDA